MQFSQRLKNEILVLDNHTTSEYTSKGRPALLMNSEHPREVITHYKESIAAGAEIITTNTQYGLPSDLKKHKAERDFERLNAEAVDLALRTSRGDVYVAGAIGGADLQVAPFGELNFDDAVSEFRQQIRILVNTGVDLLLLEKTGSLQTMRAAVIAANLMRHRIPLICLYDLNDKEINPQHLISFATIFESLDVDCLGLRGTPEKCLAALRHIKTATNLPLAGRVELAEQTDPAAQVEKLIANGVNLLGGGSGTNLELTRLIVKSIQGKAVSPRQQTFPLRIASNDRLVRIGEGLPFVKIGERINPTGRRQLSAELAEGRLDIVLRDAKAQFDSQADMLDVNVGAPLVNEVGMMAAAVQKIQSIVPLPLVIDSANPEVIEAGLKMYVGKALVNSVNGKDKRLLELLPIVKKYGAAVIGLCIDEEMPDTATKRLGIARKIMDAGLDHRIARNNLIIDPAALAIATDANSGREVLNAIRLIRDQLGLPVSLGVSNTSFGLPQRTLVHNAFLVQAIGTGLDAAILNPLDEQIHDLVAAASLFVGRDPDCRNYLKAYRTRKQAEKG